jgi:hypothetical protein
VSPPVRDDQGRLTGSDIMTTYAKPTLQDFPANEEVTISLSKIETLTIEIPNADFEPNSSARLTLDSKHVGTFAALTEGEESTPRKDVTLTLTNADLMAFEGKLVELRYEVSYEAGWDNDQSEPQMLRVEA